MHCARCLSNQTSKEREEEEEESESEWGIEESLFTFTGKEEKASKAAVTCTVVWRAAVGRSRSRRCRCRCCTWEGQARGKIKKYSARGRHFTLHSLFCLTVTVVSPFLFFPFITVHWIVSPWEGERSHHQQSLWRGKMEELPGSSAESLAPGEHYVSLVINYFNPFLLPVCFILSLSLSPSSLFFPVYFVIATELVIIAVLAVMIVTTIVGNILVCLSVVLVKKLRHPSNYLLVSLAVSGQIFFVSYYILRTFFSAPFECSSIAFPFSLFFFFPFSGLARLFSLLFFILWALYSFTLLSLAHFHSPGTFN